MQDLWIISFFLIFFHDTKHRKVRKVTDPSLPDQARRAQKVLKMVQKRGF